MDYWMASIDARSRKPMLEDDVMELLAELEQYDAVGGWSPRARAFTLTMTVSAVDRLKAIDEAKAILMRALPDAVVDRVTIDAYPAI